MGRGTWKRGNFAGSGQNWQKGYAGAQQNLANGVQTPKRSPTQAAISQINQLIAGFNAATQGGAQSQWAQGLQRAGDQGWAAGMTQFASTGLAQKAAKGAPHYAAFAQQYGPALMAASQQLPARGDFAQNQQRSAAMNQWAHAQRGKYRKVWRGGGA